MELDNQPKNILVLGGTGAMGKPLVSILEKKGYGVFVTSRYQRKESDSVKYIVGNAMDDSFLDSILGINHWDAIVDFMVYSSKKFSARVEKLVHSTNQYIFISSCRVFADKDAIITERSPRLLDVSDDNEYLKTDEYALRKAREENILRQYNNVTIVRPSVTFNDNRLQLGVYEASDWIDRILNCHTVVFSKDIASHLTTLTYGEDVANGIAGLIGNPKAIGEDFNIVTDEYFTWQGILDIYLQVFQQLNISPKIIYTDEALNLRIKKWQYQVRYARLFDRRFDNSKIKIAIPGIQFRNVKETLQNCLTHYLSAPAKKLTLSSGSIIQERASGDIGKPSDFNDSITYIKYLVLRFMPYKMLLHRIEK